MISSFNSIYCFLATYQTAMSPACMELHSNGWRHDKHIHMSFWTTTMKKKDKGMESSGVCAISGGGSGVEVLRLTRSHLEGRMFLEQQKPGTYP